MSGRTGSYNVLLAITLAKSCQYDGKRGYHICVNIELRIGDYIKKIIKVGYKGLEKLL